MIIGMNMMRPSCCLIISMIITTLLGVDMIVLAEGGRIGINWGRQSTQRMIPSMVVDLLLQNGIKEARLFNPAGNVLEAFSGSQITVSIALPNFFFYKVNTTENALNWVGNWITTFKYRVDIRYVIVGNEPFSATFRNKTYDNAVEILDIVQNALNARGYGMEIKATTPQYTDLLNIHLNKSLMPSEAEFRPEIRDKMIEYLGILKKNKAPAMVNILPIQYVRDNNLDINFAFMDDKSSYRVADKNGVVYNNAFEYLYDSFLWAMNKTGFGDMELVVSQIGWPTDGNREATVANAERFHRSFLPYIASNKGTPFKPGAIHVFLHNLSDENKLNLDWGGFQRHWGIYQFNGEPKYNIDFTGQGHNTMPSVARGITLMPKRWCIFNEDMRDNKTLNDEKEKCCKVADCTSMDEGGSCSHLDYKSKVSYAFNRYFQIMVTNQSVACDMKGFGKIVDTDPSDGRCSFPIEILAAEKKERLDEFLGERATSDNPEEYSSLSAAASVRGNVLPNMVTPLIIYIFLPLMILRI